MSLVANQDDPFANPGVYLQSKSPALHIEHKEPAARPARKDRSLEFDKRQTRVTETRIDTPLYSTPTSGQSTATLSKSLEAPQPSSIAAADTSIDVPHRIDTESSQPGSASSADAPRVATPVREYAPEPKLWVTDGPTAGKDSADWRKGFIPIFERAYGHLSFEERTRHFEELVRRCSDRYLAALAAYYGAHPEKIPDRPLDHVAADRIQRILAHDPHSWQETHFQNWTWETARNVKSPEPARGPKGEVDPDHIPHCEHCAKLAVKQAKREKRKALLDVVKRPTTRVPMLLLHKFRSRSDLRRSENSDEPAQTSPAKATHQVRPRSLSSGAAMKNSPTLQHTQAAVSPSPHQDQDFAVH